MRMSPSHNVYGEYLKPCSLEPRTGFFRDGCCNTVDADHGSHTICAVMTDEFLEYSRSKGNDLISPSPAHQFPGLKAGDQWCVCAKRWLQAHEAGTAPPVQMRSTHQRALEIVALEILENYAVAEH